MQQVVLDYMTSPIIEQLKWIAFISLMGIYLLTAKSVGLPHGVVTNMLDCNIIVS